MMQHDMKKICELPDSESNDLNDDESSKYTAIEKEFVPVIAQS